MSPRVQIKCIGGIGLCKREAHYFYEGRWDENTEYFANCDKHRQGTHDDPDDQSVSVKEISREEYVISLIMLA